MRSIHGVALGLLLAACSHPAPLPPANKSELRDGWLVALQSDVDRLANADGFQGAVRAVHGGKVELDRTFGDARCLPLGLGRRVLATLAVASLVEEGKLNFDDRLGRVLPSTRGTSLEGLEVAHLLTNSTGLAPAPGSTAEESLAAAGKVPLLAHPGERTDPSDGRPWLLVEHVVTAVGGQPFETQVRDRVLQRAGTNGTFLGPTADCPSATAGITTTADQMRVANALREGRIVKPATRDVLWTSRYELIPGAAAGLGFLVRTGDDQKARAVGLGSSSGASAYELWIDPATGDTVSLVGSSTAKVAQSVRATVTEFYALPPPPPHSTSSSRPRPH